jgi:hypothetical protein
MIDKDDLMGEPEKTVEETIGLTEPGAFFEAFKLTSLYKMWEANNDTDWSNEIMGEIVSKWVKAPKETYDEHK